MLYQCYLNYSNSCDVTGAVVIGGAEENGPSSLVPRKCQDGYGRPVITLLPRVCRYIHAEVSISARFGNDICGISMRWSIRSMPLLPPL